MIYSKLIKLPRELTNYISNLYSSITASVSTKEWRTQPFPINKGVFQGDTLSPFLFLIAFNPIIQSVAIHPNRGFAFKLSIQSEPDQQVLPIPNSYIYALWEKENSDEALDWYLAKVLSMDHLGEARLRYRKGGLTKTVCLLQIKWMPAKGNGKWFLPRSCNPPLLL